jgi:hypothetical protein
MKLGPRFDEALLRSWKRAAGVEGEYRLEFLIDRVVFFVILRDFVPSRSR